MNRAVATGVLFAFVLSIALSGCANTSGTAKGAGVGAAGGAAVGALIDKHNRWRGAVIGGAIGALLGGAFGKIADDAAAKAAAENRRVVVSQGSNTVEAVPVSQTYYNPRQHTHCRKVRKRIWKNGRLVVDRIEEVCEGTKDSSEY